LALALGSAGSDHLPSGTPKDAVRRHWLPLDDRGRFAKSERGFARDTRVVMHGRDAEGDLVRLVQRRILESASGAGRRLGIVARPGAEARIAEVLAFVAGSTDADRCLWLARGFAAIDWGQFQEPHHAPRRSRRIAPFDAVWSVLRLCHLSRDLAGGRSISVDPAVIRLLAAGDLPRAFAIALQRLRAAGLEAPCKAAALPSATALRLAASMAFPITQLALSGLARELDPMNEVNEQEVSHVG
jgi:CRISPR-associated protein Csx17